MKEKLDRPIAAHWLTTAEAATELGISKGHLLNLRADGLFKIGRDYRDVRRKWGVRATYRWHVENCEKALGVGAEFR
jgi:hypothetical protein